jgi:hypothetical protein
MTGEASNRIQNKLTSLYALFIKLKYEIKNITKKTENKDRKFERASIFLNFSLVLESIK